MCWARRLHSEVFLGVVVGDELFGLGSTCSPKCIRRGLARLVCIVRTGPGRGLQPQWRAPFKKKTLATRGGAVSWRTHLAELDSLMGLRDELGAGMKHAKAVRRCTRRHGIDNLCADVVDVRRRALDVHEAGDPATRAQQQGSSPRSGVPAHPCPIGQPADVSAWYSPGVRSGAAQQLGAEQSIHEALAAPVLRQDRPHPAAILSHVVSTSTAAVFDILEMHT